LLPYDFGVLEGWGDIVIAAFAAGLILFVPARSKVGFWGYFIWNLLGLLDIFFVMAHSGQTCDG